MAHELTHALQDQHFDLRRFEHWPKGESDAELAAHALIEGDATLAMVMYVSSNPMRALTFLKSLGSMGVDTKELDQAPRVIRESLLFPYQEGLNWTRAYKEDGWVKYRGRSGACNQPNKSCIRKSISRMTPVQVTLPDLARLLNGGSAKTSGRGRWAVCQCRHARRITRRRSPQTFAAHGPRHAATVTWHRIVSGVNGEWGAIFIDQFLKLADRIAPRRLGRRSICGVRVHW
jgi:hypothetical protein